MTARAWVALNLEPMLLGLAIVVIVVAAYVVAESADATRRGR